MKKISFTVLSFLSFILFAQPHDAVTNEDFKKTILLHKAFLSIPNLPENRDLMSENILWVTQQFENLNFSTRPLASETLPILFAEKVYDPALKTVLFYFHIDGQPVNPEAWDQEDPFLPVLKARDQRGLWRPIAWDRLNGVIDDEWRIFARAAADDKAPIIMFLAALQLLENKGVTPNFNIKIIFDPEEEYGSKALLSTLDRYKKHYASDYFVVMDGPAHNSNKPTLTFGCRGIASCSITTYGANAPQHSGHYGNYVPNPVFSLAKLLSSMKDDQGKVLIKDYYKGIELTADAQNLLASVPFDSIQLNKDLGIYTSEKVGRNYQESLQYPSLNVRQIGTSWKGKGLKTVIPEYATAYIDVRLVPETEGPIQLLKIKKHLVQQGYFVTDNEPSVAERQLYPKLVKFTAAHSVNAFRTHPDSAFGKKLSAEFTEKFNEAPIVIPLMGGTVPIVPLINALDVPTVIIPMVNMDNNQHSANENIRIGNLRQGIGICLTLLQSKF